MTLDAARDIVTDVCYFGTLMVALGMADGMVSGATHTTAETIRPAFEIVKTAPGRLVVSSVFLMCLADRVLVYGDCAVNPNPTAEQLADIAISSAATAAQFGIEPRIAMLSYSTGASGTGAEVERVRDGDRAGARARAGAAVEGPIQYDAAVDAGVARTKLPGSDVAGPRDGVHLPRPQHRQQHLQGRAALARSAIAVGPVLQGLNKPVNDLSRGATVHDIVNTVAITAIQARRERPRRQLRLLVAEVVGRRPAGDAGRRAPCSRSTTTPRRCTQVLDGRAAGRPRGSSPTASSTAASATPRRC